MFLHKNQTDTQKDKLVEDMKFQHEFKIKALRTEMERIRVEQRRMKGDVNSVRTQSGSNRRRLDLTNQRKGFHDAPFPLKYYTVSLRDFTQPGL